jgi:hypothetical protein
MGNKKIYLSFLFGPAIVAALVVLFGQPQPHTTYVRDYFFGLT